MGGGCYEGRRLFCCTVRAKWYAGLPADLFMLNFDPALPLRSPTPHLAAPTFPPAAIFCDPGYANAEFIALLIQLFGINLHSTHATSDHVEFFVVPDVSGAEGIATVRQASYSVFKSPAVFYSYAGIMNSLPGAQRDPFFQTTFHELDHAFGLQHSFQGTSTVELAPVNGACTQCAATEGSASD